MERRARRAGADRPRRDRRRGQRGDARRRRRRTALRARRTARQARLGRPLPRCDAQEKGGGEEGMSDRYTDKPFLRYVDAWVLNAIGALDEPTRAYCVAMEPQLRQGLGKTGNWDAIVAQQTEEHTSELQSIMRISYAVFC